MKYAITGASGFIGEELLAELEKRENIEITALTRNKEQNDTHQCKWFVTDYSVDSLCSVLKDTDVVVHLAGVRGTTPNPEDYVINEIMTGNLLKASVDAGVKRIVFASTISVYDDEKLIPWTEDAPLKGRTAYGDSKIACERLIEKHASNHDLSYAIVRIAQVMGEGEKRRGMMNVFTDTARAHGTLKVIGRSVAKRQYVYIKDLVKILAKAAEDHNDSYIVNVGMPNAYTNLEIAEIINEVYSNPTPIDYDDSTKETIRSSMMDISKLKETLNYTPKDMREAVICFADANRKG